MQAAKFTDVQRAFIIKLDGEYCPAAIRFILNKFSAA